MDEPEPSPQAAEWTGPVELICRECSELISVKDPAELIRALHLLHDCTASPLIAGGRE